MPRARTKQPNTVDYRVRMSQEAHREILLQQAEMTIAKGRKVSKEQVIDRHFAHLNKSRNGQGSPDN